MDTRVGLIPGGARGRGDGRTSGLSRRVLGTERVRRQRDMCPRIQKWDPKMEKITDMCVHGSKNAKMFHLRVFTVQK